MEANEGGWVKLPSEPSHNKERAAELAVFLFLIVPSMLLSFFVVQRGTVGFNFVAVSTIVRDLGLLFLVLFLVWRNGEGFNHIGWNFRNIGDEAVLGGFLFFPVFLFTSIVQLLLNHLGVKLPSTPMPVSIGERNVFQIVLTVVLVIVVAISEETIFRGYLIHRFKEITKSNVASVLFSTVVFAMGHGYEGAAGMILVSIMGGIFAIVYLWRGSLVAPMVMHFLQDFLGLVIYYNR